jgi:hypothetical protein
MRQIRPHRAAAPHVTLLLTLATVVCAAALIAPHARADERLKDIACRSVHLHYPAPAGTAFYNEVTADRSAPGTYFCACGFSAGYFGMQELGNGKKLVLFSIWDPGSQNDPNAVDKEKRVRMLYKDDAVRVGRFGNEGTGGQAFFDYDWRIGETVRFLVTAEVETGGDAGQGEAAKGEAPKADAPKGEAARTAYTGWLYLPADKQWKRLVSFSTITGGKQLSGYYSFVEDFRRNRVSATQARQAHYGNGWARGADGRWVALTRARFTADSNPATNIDAAADGDRFVLATGGETKNQGAKLNDQVDRAPAGTPPLPATRPATPAAPQE